MLTFISDWDGVVLNQIQNVDNTTFVNPSFLIKGIYATLKFDGSTAESAINVDICKLV